MINAVSYSKVAIPAQPSASFELNPKVGFFSLRKGSTVTTLNSLGVKVLAYSGGGMAPIENITTPLGFLGGSVYQRTVVRPQVINLPCAIFGTDLLRVQRIKQSLINIVAPSNATQQAADLYLRYQLIDDCGRAIGVALEAPVLFVGDLTGNTKDLNQERFVLQFMIIAPPGIVELTTNQPSLAFNNTIAHIGYEWRNAATGVWNFVTTGGLTVRALMYDASGDLWYGTSGTGAKVGTRSGSVNQATNFVATPANSAVNGIFQTPDGKVHVGGNFTSPQSYYMQYLSGAFTNSTVNSTFNSPIYRFAADNNGNVYASGSFTTPGTGLAVLIGNTWGALGSGPAGGSGVAIQSMKKGPDGKIYIAGTFSSMNGVACNNICVYDPYSSIANDFRPLGTGIGTGGSDIVNSIDFLPNGRLIAGAQVSPLLTSGNVYSWNGISWQVLGPGLNSAVNTVLVDQQTSDVYLFGAFDAVVGNVYPITPKFVRFNGSIYQPMDIYLSAPGNTLNTAVLRASDKEIASGGSGPYAFNYSGSTLITYGGTAEVLPQIKLTGPGTFFNLQNFTNNKKIYFNNLVLQAGEIATLNLGPSLSFLSSFPQANTNILGKILGGSDTSTFTLVPGANYVEAIVNNSTGASKVELIYKNTHWSFDAGV